MSSSRRSISVRGATYDRVFAHVADLGQSVSDFIEELIRRHFEAGAPIAAPPQRKTPRARRQHREEEAAFVERAIGYVEKQPIPLRAEPRRSNGHPMGCNCIGCGRLERAGRQAMKISDTSRPVAPQLARPSSGGTAKKSGRPSHPDGALKSF